MQAQTTLPAAAQVVTLDPQIHWFTSRQSEAEQMVYLLRYLTPSALGTRDLREIPASLVGPSLAYNEALAAGSAAMTHEGVAALDFADLTTAPLPVYTAVPYTPA